MTALVTVEAVILAVLCVLVAGLLRAYASVLQRLHALDGGVDGGGAATQPPPFRTVEQVPQPSPQRVQPRAEWDPAHDIDGVTLQGEIVSARTVGVQHDTVIAFLSSGCEGCTGFWNELAQPGSWQLPTAGRLLVVTKSADEESPAALEAVCPSGVDLVMSSQAWSDYSVPGSPYIVVADGRTGRIKGEGSGTSFSQISGLIRQARNDRNAVPKPAADRDREADVDRILLSAGIAPGDPRLYSVPDASEQA